MTTSGNYEDRHQVVVAKNDGSRSVLEIPNPDSFLNYIADLQNGQGQTETAHVPVHLESRLALNKNVGMWLQATDRICMMILFSVTLFRFRQLMKTMQAGTNRQRSLVLTQCRPPPRSSRSTRTSK